MITEYEVYELALFVDRHPMEHSRWRLHTRAVAALMRAARWKRPACWLVGHRAPVLIPTGGPSTDWRHICPRCGKFHPTKGEQFLPPVWP